MTKLWPSCSSNSVSALRVLMAGMVVPADGDGVREVQRTYFGGNVQMNVAIRLNHGREFQAHAELAKLNGNGGDSAGAWLHDGEGKFSSGEETGFFAIDRDQVGLGQNLEKILATAAPGSLRPDELED